MKFAPIAIFMTVCLLLSEQASSKDVILYSDPAQGYQYAFRIHPGLFESDSLRLEQGRSLGLYLVQNPDQKEILKSMATGEKDTPADPLSTDEVKKAATRFFEQQRRFGHLMGGAVDPGQFKPGVSLADSQVQTEIQDLVMSHFVAQSWTASKTTNVTPALESLGESFESCAAKVVEADRRAQNAYIVFSEFGSHKEMLEDFDLPTDVPGQDEFTAHLFTRLSRAGWSDFSTFPCYNTLEDPELRKLLTGPYDFLRYRRDVAEASLVLKRASQLKGQPRIVYLALVSLAFSSSVERGLLTRALWRKAHLDPIEDQDWRVEIRRIASQIKNPHGQEIKNSDWINQYLQQIEERLL